MEIDKLIEGADIVRFDLAGAFPKNGPIKTN
jgi:hypothetical protein